MCEFLCVCVCTCVSVVFRGAVATLCFSARGDNSVRLGGAKAHRIRLMFKPQPRFLQ